jgi:glycosyltransferase involved in cell wall biosynthesis
MFKVKKLIILFFEHTIRLNFIRIISLKRIFTPTIKNKLKNKIAFVNTYDVGGGAAKIARLLVENLTDSDTNSNRFYVKTKKSIADWVYEIESAPYTFLEEVLRREAVQKGWIEFTGFHSKRLLEDPFFKESSIIHLHNLHGEFFSPILFKSLFKDKKVIWTLHDESFITGHCSCTLGCDRWQIGCGSCPDLTIYPPVQFDNTKEVLHYKKKWITELQPIVVCPSHWLANRVRIAYPDLKNIKVIPNGVDTNVFHPKDKDEVRTLLGLPIEKKIVLFVAEFATQNPFKGGAILREIISDSTFSDVIFVTVGGSDESSFHNHICYPYIHDENELANLYTACDVLLYPTQADNLPLVVLESMACSTPVIASQLGGIPEIIDNSNGVLISDFKSPYAFKKGLSEFLDLNEDEIAYIRKNSLFTIQKGYTLTQMISAYQGLY